MSESNPIPLQRRQLVMPIPTCEVEIRRDIPFAGGDGAARMLDVYLPAAARASTPAVLIVSGYRDAGFEAATGCRFKDMAWTASWAQLFASAGLAAFTYTNEDPAADLRAVLEAICARADEWGVNRYALGVFASSGHVPVALSALMKDFSVDVKCAAFAYGYTLDLAGGSAVSDAARTFRFANPCAGRSIDDYRPSAHLLIARAGHDEMPGLNGALDAFITAALSRNLELTLLNHRDAPHAFDLVHDSDRTRAVIQSIVQFMTDELLSHCPAARSE